MAWRAQPLAAVYSAQPGGGGAGRGRCCWRPPLYHLADAVQALCVFVLRCYRVTVAPLVVYCVLLWGVGLGGGYLLAYRGLGPWRAHAVAAGVLAR